MEQLPEKLSTAVNLIHSGSIVTIFETVGIIGTMRNFNRVRLVKYGQGD